MNTLFVQLTDMHIREEGRMAYGRIDTAPYLDTAVQSILQLPQRPQAVVLTGDLTDFGRPQEYERLARLLSPLTMPWFLLPGNHDDRDQMRRSFPQHQYLGTDGFVQYSLALGEVQLIAIDTVESGASHGRLCQDRLAWLSQALDRHRDQPVVIAMHHPPFQTGIGHMDRIGLLEGADDLAALVSQHPNVERIMCGHLHRTIYRRFAGTVVSTAPSPAHQVCLDISPQAASAWNLEPPGFHLHAWSASGGLVSHVAHTGLFPGPYPFHEKGALID